MKVIIAIIEAAIVIESKDTAEDYTLDYIDWSHFGCKEEVFGYWNPT